MSERADSFDNETLSPEDMALLQFLDSWLAQAPPDLAEAARLAALPHYFDLSLLSILRGTSDGTAFLVQRLEKAGFLMAEGTYYILRPHLRTLLLRGWQKDNLAQYRQANRRAAAFYQDCLPGSENEQVEYVYHQLGSDDRRGIGALSESFEHAWNTHRRGFAERLLKVATEQAPVLGAEAQAWLQYFDARINLAYQRYPQSEDILRHLIAQKSELRLRAQVLMTLANLLVQSQRWSEAFERYAQAQDGFQALDDPFNLARVLEAQGMAYVHLATSLGGLGETKFLIELRSQKWWHYLRGAPFFLYRWFSRRSWYLPNLYVGTDYQEWIIWRLLYAAIRHFELATRQLDQVASEADLPLDELRIDIQIRLADLYHRVEKWEVAERRFKQLVSIYPLRNNEYRRATLHLGEGRAALIKSHIAEAREHLLTARDVFARYGDRNNLAMATRLLGDTEMVATNLEAAVSFYAESIAAAIATNDLLTATQVWYHLATIRERFTLSSSTTSLIEAVEQSLDHRAYIARFPGTLLQWFRRLAAYGVVPLTYLIVPPLTLIGVIFFMLIEQSLYAFFYQPLIISTIKALLPIVLFPLLTSWVYNALYLFFGLCVVRLLPLKLLSRSQPNYVVSVPDGIAVRTQNTLHELPWKAIKRFTIVDRCLSDQPLALFSRLVLISETTTIVLDGIVTSYPALQREITRRLQQTGKAVEPQNLSYSFLDKRWALITATLAMGMTVISFLGWLSDRTDSTFFRVELNDGSTYSLPLSTLVVIFFVWLLLLFPPITLARLLYNRFVARRALGSRLPWGADWPLWLALILLLAWLLAWFKPLTQ